VELMYRGESKSIIFRLSLRKFDQPTSRHSLMHVEVDYTNTLTGRREKICSPPIEVVRPAVALLERVPLRLDQHLNRYAAATAITESIELARKCQYLQAQRRLQETVEAVRRSPSGNEPYCEDLISDLKDCLIHMATMDQFETLGIHTAYAYASMYFMERSTGIIQRLQRNNPIKSVRHLGYGYVTEDQETEAKRAVHETASYVPSYLPVDVTVH